MIGRPRNSQIMKHVTTTLPLEDYNYVKSKGLRFQNLLMMAVRDHKVHAGEPDAEPTMRELIERVERMSKTIRKQNEAVKNIFGEEGHEKFLTESLKETED